MKKICEVTLPQLLHLILKINFEVEVVVFSHLSMGQLSSFSEFTKLDHVHFQLPS